MFKKMLSAPIAISLAACASIVGDTKQLISVKSSPDQAEIRIVDEHGTEAFDGTTPASVSLKKGGGYFDGKDYTVKVQKVGYQPQTIDIKSHPNGWYLAGNLIFGGVIGYLIVDPLTGAMWTLSPDAVDTDLVSTTTSGKETSLKVVLVQDVDPSLRQSMVQLN